MIFNKDSWKEIFDTIKKNKLRTFLSGFTVAIGILIFIILFGLGNGLQNSFGKFFTDDKVNTIRLYPSSTTIPYRGYESNRRIKFTNSDLIDLLTYLSETSLSYFVITALLCMFASRFIYRQLNLATT